MNTQGIATLRNRDADRQLTEATVALIFPAARLLKQVSLHVLNLSIFHSGPFDFDDTLTHLPAHPTPVSAICLGHFLGVFRSRPTFQQQHWPWGLFAPCGQFLVSSKGLAAPASRACGNDCSAFCGLFLSCGPEFSTQP